MNVRSRKIALGTALSAAGVWAYAHGVEHRSATSWIAEHILPARKAASIFGTTSKQAFQEKLAPYYISNERPVANPSLLVGQKVEEIHVHGMQVFVWNNKHNPSQPVLLYTHGGGYVHQPSIMHYISVARIARLLDARVVFPIYPKLPNHTFEETFQSLDALYRIILPTVDSSERITIMGDSAGGGLALAFAMYIRDHHLAQPKHIVLLSPWTDIATNNRAIAQYEPLDPMLKAWPIQQLGKLWATPAATNHNSVGSSTAKPTIHNEQMDYARNPYVSPLYGTFDHLGTITIVVGTHELLYPDSERLHQALSARGIRHHYIVGDKMNHVYPIYPIPEAWRVQRNIASIIAKH